MFITSYVVICGEPTRKVLSTKHRKKLHISGQLLTVVFGADAPRIARTIEQELQNEELAKKGELKRPQRAPHELTTPEQEVANKQQKMQEERKAKEVAAVDAARFARREARAQRLETHFVDVCPGLLLPHAQKGLRKIGDVLEPNGLILADKCPIVLGKEGSKIIAIEDPELAQPFIESQIVERPSLALMIKKMPEKEGCVIELARRAIFGDGLEESEMADKKLPGLELRVDNVPALFIPKDRHQRAAALDLLFPKMVGSVIEPPVVPEPPHIAIMFGAWQRRSVLAMMEQPKTSTRLLRYGFFADDSVEEPRLLAKNIDQYELRPEKDYCETIVLMLSVGLAEPLLGDPNEPFPEGPPNELMTLGPLHISEDAVVGAQECLKFFPPGYSDPEKKPRTKGKKKKKRRQENNAESVEDTERTQSTENADGEANGEENGEEEGETNGEEDGSGEGSEENDGEHADKATSPPPPTPH